MIGLFCPLAFFNKLEIHPLRPQNLSLVKTHLLASKWGFKSGSTSNSGFRMWNSLSLSLSLKRKQQRQKKQFKLHTHTHITAYKCITAHIYICKNILSYVIQINKKRRRGNWWRIRNPKKENSTEEFASIGEIVVSFILRNGWGHDHKHHEAHNRYYPYVNGAFPHFSSCAALHRSDDRERESATETKKDKGVWLTDELCLLWFWISFLNFDIFCVLFYGRVYGSG